MATDVDDDDDDGGDDDDDDGDKNNDGDMRSASFIQSTRAILLYS